MFRKLAMISLFCLFVTWTSATGDPLPGDPPECTKDCTDISLEYYCTSKGAGEYSKTNCSACSFGAKVCQSPGMGGNCNPATGEVVTLTIYKSGFPVCTDSCKLRDTVHGMLLPSDILANLGPWGRMTCQ